LILLIFKLIEFDEEFNDEGKEVDDEDEKFDLYFVLCVFPFFYKKN